MSASRTAARWPGPLLHAIACVLFFTGGTGSLLGQSRHRVGIDVDNDILVAFITGKPTDYEYTHGTRLWAESDRLGLLPWLLKDPLRCRSSGACRHRVVLSQELYTPRRDSPEPVEGERPHAAWLYIAAETLRETDRKTTRLGLLFGIVGPEALGEEVQRAVHERFRFRMPMGWNHQLPLEPTLQLRISQERRLLFATRGPAAYGLTLDLGADVGNALITGASQIAARLCLGRQRCSSSPSRSPGLVLRAGLGTRAVLRNIFLDGTLQESHSVEKEHLVPTAMGSILVRAFGLELVYAVQWRAREYRTEPAGFSYGMLSVGYGW